MNTRQGTTRLGRAILATALLLSLAGCGTAATPQVPSPGSAVPPLPAGWADPAVFDRTPPPACPHGVSDPRQSYQPFSGPASGPTLDEIRQRGRLIVGVAQNTYGLSYRDPTDGAMTGFEIDIVREIAKQLLGSPDDVTYIAQNTQDWLNTLEINPDGSRKDPNGPIIDMALGTMTMNCQRWTMWAFSTQYLQVNQRIAVERTSTVSSALDLGGQRVCSPARSTNLPPLTQVQTTNGKPIHLVSAPATADCVAMLEEGVVDAVSTGDVNLAGFIAEDKSLKIVGPPIITFACGIGFPKNEIDLIRFVNGVLADIREDGQNDQSNSLWSQYYAQTLQTAQNSAGSSGASIPKPPVPMYLAGSP